MLGKATAHKLPTEHLLAQTGFGEPDSFNGHLTQAVNQVGSEISLKKKFLMDFAGKPSA